MAKNFLRERGIQFTERDVSQDSAAANEMVGRSGQMGVPVIIVDEEVVIGFDRERLDSLILRGTVSRPPSFGLRVADAASVAQKLGLSAVEGAYVGGVSPGSPGERAGLREGDIVTEVNFQPVRNGEELQKAVSGLGSGRLVTIRFLRGGEKRQSDITL
ncbi:MAG: PDZ domain-containing protein [Chloroflexota bacterium]